MVTPCIRTRLEIQKVENLYGFNLVEGLEYLDCEEDDLVEHGVWEL